MPHKDKTANRRYQKEWARKRRVRQRADGTRRDYFLRQRYDISEKEWGELFDQQGRKCAICRSDKPQSKIGWHTDHDHTTGKVRGILCENCNRGLGMYGDDVALLRRAVAYLGVHQGIINGETIRKLGIISPCLPRTRHNGMTFGISFAGYDIRIDQDIELEPKGFKLASSMEHFDVPNDLVGMVCDKSSLARRGLQAFNTVIEPGWRGYLTLELFNCGNEPIILKTGDPIVQVIFNALDCPADPYEGKYQDQPRGPQPAKFDEVS